MLYVKGNVIRSAMFFPSDPEAIHLNWELAVLFDHEIIIGWP